MVESARNTWVSTLTLSTLNVEYMFMLAVFIQEGLEQLKTCDNSLG